MTVVPPNERRFLPSGDEAGTAPGDRAFRPDIEGLRGVAVAVVMAHHFRFFWLGGGYIGVDVFFVISGFVITGLLLRERAEGGTSFVHFYARRCRRILPMALLVPLATVVSAYTMLGRQFGAATANDTRWATSFLYNVHYAHGAKAPISLLSSFWSLAVEEQFYLVFPILFVGCVVCVTRSRAMPQMSLLVVVLVLGIASSFALSVIQTQTDPRWAYVSPFTRAWELAIGALLAVSTRWLIRAPVALSTSATWIGLGLIVLSAFLLDVTATGYPGWRASLPVLGAALIIAGGMRRPRWGAERALATTPLRLVGQRSYSLYLWHWPVLILADGVSGSASLWKARLPAFAVAVVLSVCSYSLVEQPLRHNRSPARRALLTGLGATGGAFLVSTLIIAHYGP